MVSSIPARVSLAYWAENKNARVIQGSSSEYAHIAGFSLNGTN